MSYLLFRLTSLPSIYLHSLSTTFYIKNHEKFSVVIFDTRIFRSGNGKKESHGFDSQFVDSEVSRNGFVEYGQGM